MYYKFQIPPFDASRDQLVSSIIFTLVTAQVRAFPHSGLIHHIMLTVIP